MRADERETVLVFINVVDRDLPPIGVVTEFALGSILAAMEVCVAVLALVGRVGKFQIRVAVAASHRGVPSAEREAGLRVIEPDLAGNNLPVHGGVTGVARDVELPVRALRGSDGPRGLNAPGAHG